MPQRLFAAVFLVAIGLRVALCLVNAEANDDHMTPISMIRETGRLPVRADCPECFQPKLFHAAAAGVLEILRLPRGSGAVRAVQALNLLAGVWTLWVLSLFLNKLAATPEQRLLAFALAAFNPYLIAAHAQASNDAFVILFSTLALQQLFLYFGDERERPRRLAAVTACAVFAALSKGSGWALFLGIAAALFGDAYFAPRGERGRRVRWLRAVAFAAVFLLVVPFFGQYAYNYRAYGNPFITNVEPDELPGLFEETYPPRPGIVSIARSYFTFDLVGLLERPAINTSDMLCVAGDRDACAEIRGARDGREELRAPRHQTSFWTVLYGTTHSLNYYQWPKSWRSRSPASAALARATLAAALFPTAVFVIGFFAGALALARSARRRRPRSPPSPRFLGVFFSTAFIAFLIAYTLTHRDFSAIKAIYIFPALPCFLAVFVEGADVCSRRRGAKRILQASVAVLCAFYAADVASVIARLIST
jgi:hypothetical protein